MGRINKTTWVLYKAPGDPNVFICKAGPKTLSTVNIVNEAIAAINVDHAGGEKVINANARLMVAAPDLLEALQAARYSIDVQLQTRGGPQHMIVALKKIKNAITKATGGEE